MDRPIYLDHAATTPMREDAVAAMLPFLSDRFANPSGSHRFARDARRAVDESRDTVADAIGCRPGEVVFTGCGTEADNAAIAGAVGGAVAVVAPCAPPPSTTPCCTRSNGSAGPSSASMPAAASISISSARRSATTSRSSA